MHLCEDTQNLLPLRQLIEGNLDNFISLLQWDFHRGSHTVRLPGTVFLFFDEAFRYPRSRNNSRKFVNSQEHIFLKLLLSKYHINIRHICFFTLFRSVHITTESLLRPQSTLMERWAWCRVSILQKLVFLRLQFWKLHLMWLIRIMNMGSFRNLKHIHLKGQPKK